MSCYTIGESIIYNNHNVSPEERDILLASPNRDWKVNYATIETARMIGDEPLCPKSIYHAIQGTHCWGWWYRLKRGHLDLLVRSFFDDRHCYSTSYAEIVLTKQFTNQPRIVAAMHHLGMGRGNDNDLYWWHGEPQRPALTNIEKMKLLLYW